MTSPAVIARNAQNTGEVFLALLTMTHESLDTPLYFVNDLVNLTSNSIEYVSWPFDLPFPEVGGDTLPSLTLTIDNVDRAIWTAIKDITTPIDVTLSYVIKSNPDQIEGGPLYLRMLNVEVGITTISGSLNFEDLLNSPYPSESYVPSTSPGLF